MMPIVHALVDDERDEAAQLGNLHGDGQDVHTEDAVLDQIQLAAIVQLVTLEGLLDRVNRRLARRCVVDLVRLGDLLFLPACIVWVELAEDKHQLVQHSHRKRAGAASRIDDFECVDGVDKTCHLCRLERVRLVGVGQQVTQASVHILARSLVFVLSRVEQLCF